MRIRRSDIKFVVLLMLPLLCQGQKSDLYLFDFNRSGDQIEIEHARFISGFNIDGYNNQASFVNENRVLITAAPAEQPQATDIYELDLRQSTYKRLTKTSNREYSPMISDDPTYISCVVVEVDQDNNQRLWLYPTDLSHGGKAILNTAKQVGYYCFLKNNWVAVFEVDTPNILYGIHAETGERKLIHTNIGRSLHRSKDGQLVFVHKFSSSYWMLKKWDPVTGIKETIKKTIPEAEDFVLLPDDSIIMGSGSKIYRLDVNGDNQWSEIANLSTYGISKITRLAYDGASQLIVTDSK